MAKVLVAYFSATGNTEKMAKLVAEGAEKAGAEVTLARVSDLDAAQLLDYDGLIIGSPTYYGGPAAEVRKLFDESVKYHGQLEGKVGAAFASSANIGGGNETTVLSILTAMLIHGMVCPGVPKGDHYGPVSINAPDVRVENQCRALGARVARLAERLA